MEKNIRSLNISISLDGYSFENIPPEDITGTKERLEKKVNDFFKKSNFSNSLLTFGCAPGKRRGVAAIVYVHDKSQEKEIDVSTLEAIILEETRPFIFKHFQEKERRFEISFKIQRVVEEDDGESYIDKMAASFVPVEPVYDFEQLVINNDTLNEIETALLAIDEDYEKYFQSWGLNKIEPFSRSVLNFYGPPGTGKTMAAHAIAHRYKKKLIIAGCPELQSKYHGEGPKNVKAVFRAAEQTGSILFFDEADSLISKRLEEVSTGSEDEINNMRNAMLTCLETHRGIVIFASNFVKRYDYAFETRIQSILFPMPDIDTLIKIWEKHFLASIPRDGVISLEHVAKESLEFCGRDVKNAVINACRHAFHSKKMSVSEADLISACKRITESRNNVEKNKDSITGDKTPDSLRDIVEKNNKSWESIYLEGIPLDASFDLCNVIEKSLSMSERDIRQSILYACYLADKKGANYVSSTDIIDAMQIILNAKGLMDSEDNESHDEILEILQQIVNRRKNNKIS